ncbi:MAG: membrane-bound lytic murein transglycosylase MltF [Pseudomonadota bacterium]
MMHRLPRLPLGLVLLALLFAGCSRLDPPGPGQPLVVGLPTDPVFQQLAPPTEGMEGFSRDLTGLFAETLGVEIRYVTAPDYPAMQEMVRTGEVHFAAALPARYGDPELRYSPPLRETRQVVVQHSTALPTDRPEQLAGREITVLPGAPQIQVLKSMNIAPPPLIVERPGIDELELLADVERRRHDLAATDDLHYTVAANFHPDLSVALELPGTLAYVWAFHAENDALREQAARFIEQVRQDGTLRRLDDRYFGHIRRLDARDIAAFLEQMRTRLPDYRQDFQEAQEITGIDWRLLAALAYQESKWDPLATSYTGVRGIMMLTEDTADRLKVSNRLDPKQSIRAGAKYLAMLMDELPEEIKPPDRLWFALAAYNLGMGHLRGARSFAPGLNRDPNSWADMKQVLPLMARPEYYTRLKSGRARGGEAVILTENIRNYFDVLSRFEPVYTPPSIDRPKPISKKKRRVKRKASAPRA